MEDEEDDVPSFTDIAKKLVPAGKSFYTQDEMLQIYTDWANHYLERSLRHKRLIQDLQHDIADGVLLADIVEAVTNERLRDIKAKPKNGTQMLENINVCLKCIENLGVNIEGLKAEDIREGNLRAILGLFFSLSRYKQQKKSGLLPPSSHTRLASPVFTKIPSGIPVPTEDMLSRLPSPFKPAQPNRNSTGTIPPIAPVVATSGQNRRSLTSSQKDKVSGSGIPAPRLPAQTSRPVSPGAANSPHSLIPAPSSKLPAPSGEKINRQSRSSSNTSSGISLASSTNKPGAINWSSPRPTGIPVSSAGNLLSTSGAAAMGKTSMFGFGFFQKTKPEKTTSGKIASTSKQSGERNSGCSSSSGFSSGSGKSELSDNSSGAGSEAIVASPTFAPLPREAIYENTSTSITNSPKLAMKALAKRTFSRSPNAPSKEPPRPLKIEPREEEPPRTRLPGPSAPESNLAGRSTASRLPKPSGPVKIEPARNGSRGLLRPLTDSQISSLPEEESSPFTAPVLRGPAPPVRSSVLDAVDPARDKAQGSLPTPSSGIPRTVTVAMKIPAKSAKLEKRLSFPANAADAPKSSTSNRLAPNDEPDERRDENSDQAGSQVAPPPANANANATSDSAPIESASSTEEPKQEQQSHQMPTNTQPDSLHTQSAASDDMSNDDMVWKLNHTHGPSQAGQQNSPAPATQPNLSPSGQQTNQSPSTVDETANSPPSVPMTGSTRRISPQRSDTTTTLPAPDEQSSPATLPANDANILQSNSDRNQIMPKQAAAVSRANRSGSSSASKLDGGARRRMVDANVGVGGRGYMSDGDTLKCSSTLSTTTQLCVFDEDGLNGYISEDGGMTGSGMSSRGRVTGRPRERMPLLKESSQQMSSGRGDGFDYDDGVPTSTYQNGHSERKSSDPSSHFNRTFPYSSLSYRTPPYMDSDESSTRSPVPAMPLLRGPSLRPGETSSSSNSPRTPKPAPISPPPRDPETTLSNQPRLMNGNNAGSGYPNGSTTTDNYLRIYASPARRPRVPVTDVFANLNQSDSNPGELFTLNYGDDRLSNGHNKSTLERRTAKISGSTQTSPQENGCNNNIKQSSGSHYSTNSLNRNMNRHAPFCSPYSAQSAPDGPPRCRSVVQSHGEMSVAPSSSAYLSSSGMVNPYMPNASASVYDTPPETSKAVKASVSRFSMPNQHPPELSVFDMDRITPAPVAALPPKSSRTVRQNTNGHRDSQESREYDRNSGGHSTQGIYARAGSGRDGHYRENGSMSSPSTWESHRSPSHSARGHPLAYSMNTHGQQYNADDMDTASTVSFQMGASNRASSPGSPIMTFSLPRQGQSSGLSLRSNVSPFVGSLLSKIHAKDDDAHGSNGSLISTASSIYSTPEERHAHDVRKLRRELEHAHERVATLTNQLAANSHLVAAFEHSLDSLTHRSDMLTSSGQRKDGELSDLRRTIDSLRRHGTEAGLINSVPPAVSPSLVRRHTFNSAKDGAAAAAGESDERPPPGLSRQMSTDSVVSLNSLASNCSTNELDEEGKKKSKKKSWVQSKECRTIGVSLRSSFGKALSRVRPKNKHGSSETEDHVKSHLPTDLSTSVPNSPLLHASRAASRASRNSSIDQSGMKSASSFSELGRMDEREETVLVEDLQRQLREKEMILNDFRLEALNSAQQLDQYKESVNRMKNELDNLRQDNMRLQRLVTVKRRSLSSERKSPHDGGARSTPSESGIGDDDSPTFDARRIAVKVVAFENGSMTEAEAEEVSIGSIKINPVMRWDQLDKSVRQLFKEYIFRLDGMTNLGLSPDSISCYHIGNALRNRDDFTSPDSFPCDYIKSDNEKIRVILKGSREHALDLISFESLIPKSLLQRYVSLITENNRVILCGPSGTGKSFLARKIAQHMVLKSGRQTTDGAVVTFCVEETETTAKDLRSYLMQLVNQCENHDRNVPSVVIIDNLHHVASLGDLFNGFLSVKNHSCPFIIGTMNQSSCKPANLHLKHNFRWIMCQNSAEPVQGFLVRYLRRKIVEHEMNVGVCDSALTKIVEWIPRVWQHINTLLEQYSSDLTLGPQSFLACPMKVRESQLWFTSLWNYSLVPYILAAVKGCLEQYGRYSPWEDPREWIMQTYPWPSSGSQEDPEIFALNSIRQEDVGFKSYGFNATAKSPDMADAVDESEVDPLSDLYTCLKETARYSSHQADGSSSLDLLSDQPNTTTKTPASA